MLLDTLGASLLGNLLTVKVVKVKIPGIGIIQAGEGRIGEMVKVQLEHFQCRLIF